MNFFTFIFQDWKFNKGNTKGRIAALFFRTANFCRCNKMLIVLFFPYLIFYKILFEWIIGMEIPYRVAIGKGLKIMHLQAIVIHKKAIIGTNCQLRHSVTIGNKDSEGESPVVGNNVNIGAHVCIIGDIHIGDNVTIGAGSVVVKDIPPDSVAAGNPARVIKRLVL